MRRRSDRQPVSQPERDESDETGDGITARVRRAAKGGQRRIGRDVRSDDHRQPPPADTPTTFPIAGTPTSALPSRSAGRVAGAALGPPSTGLAAALTGVPRRADLQARLARYGEAAAGAYAPSTERAIAGDLRRFAAWCAGQGLADLPAAPETIRAYVDAQARTLMPATLRRRLASIALLHRAAGLADPTRSDLVRLACRRARRRRGTDQRQAAPLGEDAVAAILAALGDGLRDRRDRALLLVARDLLARRGELVALDVGQVRIEADGSAIVRIVRGKGDLGGRPLWLGPRAVHALTEWLDAAGIRDGALFRRVHKGGRSVGGRLAPEAVAERFRAIARRAGLDPTGISGHSCRVGMALDLAVAGSSLPELMVAGRWSGPAMPARYIRRLEPARGAVARYHRRREG